MQHKSMGLGPGPYKREAHMYTLSLSSGILQKLLPSSFAIAGYNLELLSK